MQVQVRKKNASSISFIRHKQMPLSYSTAESPYRLLLAQASIITYYQSTTQCWTSPIIQFPELKIRKDTSKKVEEEEKEPNMIFVYLQWQGVFSGFYEKQMSNTTFHTHFTLIDMTCFK
jgi:hypothetical protein